MDHPVALLLRDESFFIEGFIEVEKPELLGNGGFGLLEGMGSLVRHGSGLLSWLFWADNCGVIQDYIMQLRFGAFTGIYLMNFFVSAIMSKITFAGNDG